MFVFKSAIPLISLKLLISKPNKDDIFLIWEKFIFPFVRNKLVILVPLFTRFKLIMLSTNSRSYIEPFSITILYPLPSTSLKRMVLKLQGI